MNSKTPAALRSLVVTPASFEQDGDEGEGEERLGEDHPLAAAFGAIKDDPMLDLMIENIKAYRLKVDQEEDVMG